MSSDVIRFSCPKCAFSFKALPTQAGKKVVCGCGQQVDVPLPAYEPPMPNKDRRNVTGWGAALIMVGLLLLFYSFMVKATISSHFDGTHPLAFLIDKLCVVVLGSSLLCTGIILLAFGKIGHS